MATASHQDYRSGKYGVKFYCTIENFRFCGHEDLVYSNIFAEQLNKTKWEVKLNFSEYNSSHFSGTLKQQNVSDAEILKLFIIIFIVDDDTDNKIVLKRFGRYVNPTTEIKFERDIQRGRAFPYENLSLCICMQIKNVPATASFERRYFTVIGTERFEKVFHLETSELGSSSSTEFFIFESADESLPKLKFRLLRIGSKKNVYLEMIKLNEVSDDVIFYCKVSVFNNACDYTVQSFAEELFLYNGKGSNSVCHLKNVLSNDGFQRCNAVNNMTLLLELCFSTNCEFTVLEIENDLPWGLQNVRRIANTPKDSQEPKIICLSTASQTLSEECESAEDLAGTLLDDIWHVYNEKKYSDLTICTGGQFFNVHKTILQARSPVFGTMLESNMTEKLSGVVKIEDAKPEIIDSFLKFIYSDILPDESSFNMFVGLYSIADKYEVINLKQKCFRILKSKIGLSTVCDVLTVADLHGDILLKDAALEYIKKNSTVMFKSEEWKYFMLSNSQLAAETMHSYLI